VKLKQIMRRLKSLFSKFKKSRFFLGVISLAIGVSLTVCFYEGDKLYQDYSEAMGYYYDISNREVVPTTSLATPKEESGEGFEPTASTGIEDKIRDIAEREGFENADLLIRIASCESGLIPRRDSDVSYSSAKGLFQILDMHGLTAEERYDIDVSTTWAINKIRDGGLSAWNASKHCWNI